jgi:hypothetical protein
VNAEISGEGDALRRVARAAGTAIPGNPSTETATLNALGETWRMMGQPARAYGSYHAALGIAERTGHRRQQAQAMDGLGVALRDLGRLG